MSQHRRPRGAPRPWSAVELAYVRENCGRLSVRQMAAELGRPKSTVDRKAREARAAGALGAADVRAPAGSGMPDPGPDTDPGDTEARLSELASVLRTRVLEADERNVARIAAEYRETLEAIKGAGGAAGEGQDGGGRLANLLRTLQP